MTLLSCSHYVERLGPNLLRAYKFPTRRFTNTKSQISWRLQTYEQQTQHLCVRQCHPITIRCLDMNHLIIQAWVEEVGTSSVDSTLAVDSLLAHRRRLSDEVSSPPKRPRTTEYSDPNETPTRPRPQSVRHDSDGVVFDDPATQGVTSGSTSSFTAVHANRAFSAPTAVQQAPTSDTTRSRRSSLRSDSKRRLAC